MSKAASIASPAAPLPPPRASIRRALGPVVLALVLVAPGMAVRASGAASWSPDPPGTDALWSGGFASPEFDGAVYVAIRSGNGVVVGGDFRLAGGVPARGVARWDGTRWTPLGDGLAATVTFLCGNGDTIWAGWNTSDPVGTPQGWIAMWDGQAWQPRLAAPPIASMISHRGRLTVRGLGPAGLEVDQWDGTQWVTLGAPGAVASGFDGALFSDGDSLWASGRFSAQGDLTQTPVLEVWDGSQWSVRARATDDPGTSTVLAIGEDSGALVIGGEFAGIDGVALANVARREGGAWQPMAAGLAPRVRQITDDGTGHVLVYGPRVPGSFWGTWPGVFRWDGSVWHETSLDLFPEPNGIVADAAGVFPFGTFQQDGYTELHSFARLDAGGAHAVPDPGAGTGGFGGVTGSGAVDALASFGGAVIAGGAIALPGDTIVWDGGRGVMRRENGTWRSLTDGTYFSGRVLALLPYGGRLLAGGRFGMVLDGRPCNALAAWDGARWWPMGSFDDAVRTFAIYRGELYAAGDFQNADGLLCDHVARWTGSRWLPVGPPPVGAVRGTGVQALAVWRDRLIAGGDFTSMAGDTLNRYVAAWDGTQWSSVGVTQPLGPVACLAATDSVLFAGNRNPQPFPDQIGPDPLHAWDGAGWSPVPTPDNAGIHALLPTPQGLVVGATFLAGDASAVGLARFDGSQWSPFGSSVGGVPGFDVSAHALLPLPDGLWVGGAFTLAGGRPSSRIARFEGLAPAIPPAGSIALSVAPSPTNGPITLRFRIAAAGRVVVRVFDIAGRERAVAHDGTHEAGPVVVAWDTGMARHGGLESGIYLVRVESPGESARTTRIAVVR